MHIGAFDAVMLPDLLAQMKKDGLQVISLEKRIGSGLPQRSGRGAGGWRDTARSVFYDSKKLKYPPHADQARRNWPRFAPTPSSV